MKDVVKPGDVVLVRVAASKPGPAELARAGKPVAVALEQVPKVQGALVAIDPRTRGVRALVGGYDFGTSQFNRANQAKRQPGSAFKPFVWGTAVETRRYTPATLVRKVREMLASRKAGRDQISFLFKFPRRATMVNLTMIYDPPGMKLSFSSGRFSRKVSRNLREATNP
jgi:penicillin-binding protein 1A